MANPKIMLLAMALMIIVLAVPVLAQPASTEDEDQYKLKDEWKNKNMVVEKQGELTHIVFFLTETGDWDQDKLPDAYILLGYKWPDTPLPVQYTINPSAAVKNYKLDQTAVVQEVKKSFEAWDGQLNDKLFSDTPATNNKAKASIGRPDYKNVVTWGTLSDPNVIAMTTIWYNTRTKQIIDTDMVFNTRFKWGIDKDDEGPQMLPANTFDIQNIGTHEAGHVCGLGDIYDSTYSDMTMYGYASSGEVYKVSLDGGDIEGVKTIYPLL